MYTQQQKVFAWHMDFMCLFSTFQVTTVWPTPLSIYPTPAQWATTARTAPRTVMSTSATSVRSTLFQLKPMSPPASPARRAPTVRRRDCPLPRPTALQGGTVWVGPSRPCPLTHCRVDAVPEVPTARPAVRTTQTAMVGSIARVWGWMLLLETALQVGFFIYRYIT